MNIFFKAVATTLAALILWLSVESRSKEISVLLTLCVSAMILLFTASFLDPVISLIQKIIQLGELEESLVSVVLKAVGMGFVAEITFLVCKDAKNETLGKALQFLYTSAVIWISIPVIESFLDLIDGILGGL